MTKFLHQSLYCICATLLLTSGVMARDLTEVRAVAATGALQLALEVLEDEQPAFNADATGWLDFEELRYDLYRQAGMWQEMVERIQLLPANVPSGFRVRSLTNQAGAYLELQQGESARAILRRLVWLDADAKRADSTPWMPQWRRMIVQSYLGANSYEDAETAISRYQLDYAGNSVEDALLYARILLLNDRASQALHVLRDYAQDPRAAVLQLIAQLRAEERPSTKVLQAALRQVEVKGIAPELSLALWGVVAEAAQRSGDRASAAHALEQVFSERQTAALTAGLLKYDVDALWNAYIDYALYLGNQSQFLIGQDKKWFDAAAQLMAKTPVKARSLLALLMLRGQDTEYRTRAAQAFVESLKDQHTGRQLLHQLFLTSRQFSQPAQIPVSVRHTLVDILIAQSDLDAASRLMATIAMPPDGSDNFMWHLRRARILILGKKLAEGAQSLQKVLAPLKKLSDDDVDKTLQVVFDLQSAEEHAQAISLFQLISDRTSDAKRRREIFYWMAESMKAQEDYASAARMYLRSALYDNNNGLDMWGQTARYQAAEALAHAGMNVDAQRLFEQLLSSTQEPGRRAVILKQLQALRRETSEANAGG